MGLSPIFEQDSIFTMGCILETILEFQLKGHVITQNLFDTTRQHSSIVSFSGFGLDKYSHQCHS